MKTRHWLAALASIASLGASFTVGAQDGGLQSYDVELIIFRVNRPTGSQEDWTHGRAAAANGARGEEESSPTPAAATPNPEPSTAPANDPGFPALNANQFRMNGVEETLRKGKSYQPLAHIGWTQPGFPLGSSPKVSLQSYLPGFLPEGVALNGEASLSRGPRLLHLMLDLTYQAPDGQRYVLRETRRMKSTEKHYLDHPYFGVIALITPKS